MPWDQWGEKGRDQETEVNSGMLSHVEDLGHWRTLLSEHSALDGSPHCEVSQWALVVKNPPANAGGLRDANLIPGLGRSPRGGHSNTLQDSCLENPTDRRARWATVQGVSKFQACLNLLNRHTTLWLPLLEVYFLKPYFLPSVATRM